jgi:hypothetical protein
MTQLHVYRAFASSSHDISCLEFCLASLHGWFLLNELAVNPSKREVILQDIHVNDMSRFITFFFLSQLRTPQLHLDIFSILTCISSITFARSVGCVRSALSDELAKTIAVILVCAKLDYASSVLCGNSQQHLASLQRLHNAHTWTDLQLSTALDWFFKSMLFNLHCVAPCRMAHRIKN